MAPAKSRELSAATSVVRLSLYFVRLSSKNAKGPTSLVPRPTQYTLQGILAAWGALMKLSYGRQEEREKKASIFSFNCSLLKVELQHGVYPRF
jgi:hypothetical protein